MLQSSTARLKFARFYESVKQFVIDIELSESKEIIGSDIQTIEKLEIELGFKLPDFLFSFFEHFGEEIRVKRDDELLCFAINDFKYANLRAKKEDIITVLRDKKGLKDYWEEDLIWHVSDLMNLDNALIINYMNWFKVLLYF